MAAAPHVVLLFNLLQDVNILRPLAFLAKREFGRRVLFLVSDKFLERDKQKTWAREIALICAAVDGTTHVYASELEAFAVLQRKSGVIVAASESHLAAHAETHNVLRVAPSSFLKITLQHGYECVGFMHNRAHDAAHGRDIRFAADVVCSWCEPQTLTALGYSERPKLYVTGPSAVLNAAFPGYRTPPATGGLVCENLHSVRLRTRADTNVVFLDTFSQFCRHYGGYGIDVNLRPHPGGQYVLKNAVDLPDNVVIQNQPIYAMDLTDFDFAISAPSSVLMDFVLAGVPTAVWQDPSGSMDVDNYSGLVEICGLPNWLAFARDATMRRTVALTRQKAFLESRQIVIDPDEVYERFARLFANAMRVATAARSSRVEPASPPSLSVAMVGMMQHATALSNDIAGAGYAVATWAAGTERQLAERIERDRVSALVCDADADDAVAIVQATRSAGAALVCRFTSDMSSAPRSAAAPAGSVDLLLSAADLVICSSADDKAFARLLGCGADVVVLDAAEGDESASSLGQALAAATSEAAARDASVWAHATPAGIAAGARPLGTV